LSFKSVNAMKYKYFELENPLLLVILMRNKYLLRIINEIESIMGLLKDLIYIYKYRKIITLVWTIILDEDVWQFIMSLTLIL